MLLHRLRELREDNDLRQKDIAAFLGICAAVYSRYERGSQTMPVHHIMKLADYYQTSMDYIVGRTSNAAPYPKRKKIGL